MFWGQFYVSKEVSYAHQGSICKKKKNYRKNIKIVKYYNLK